MRHPYLSGVCLSMDLRMDTKKIGLRVKHLLTILGSIVNIRSPGLIQ